MYFVLRPFLLRGMKWTKVMRTKFTLTGWTCCRSYSPGNDRGNLGLPKLSARTCFSVCKAAALVDTNTWDRNKDSTVDLTGKQKDCLSLSMGDHHGTESWLWLLTWHCWGLFSKLQWQTWPFLCDCVFFRGSNTLGHQVSTSAVCRKMEHSEKQDLALRGFSKRAHQGSPVFTVQEEC